ncbi:MAG: Na/Pi cotransporter family protein [Porphyromonas sp.]|nr:Na/Pi cotransporter family protein [Porphyromonas sp.]
MDFGFFQVLQLVGSLGIFLYGMKVMSEGLQKIAGDRLRNFLSAMTSNRVFGIFTGLLITILVQSSSATTLMVVSFANAGLVTLGQAISVIMGANIGTTVTAWVISLFGFKIDIAAYAVPIVALSIPFIFSGKSNRKSWGEFIIGFAFLFIGLQYLKDSVPDLKSHPQALEFLKNYASGGFGSTILFMFIGTILTIVVQSSSATVAITLIMCSKGWISFELATAMVLGENIGTTITANIAAIGANVTARRTAIAHLLFNVFGVLFALIFFSPFIKLVVHIISNYGPGDPRMLFNFLAELGPERTALLETDMSEVADTLLLQQIETRNTGIAAVSFGLSLFHTLFNVFNVLVMIWFVNVYVYICRKIISDKKQKSKGEEFQLKYISFGMLSTAELSIAQAQKEMAVFGERTSRMLDMVKELVVEKDEEKFAEIYNRVEKYENICDRMELEIANYLSKVSEGRLSAEGKEHIRNIIRAVTEIESIGDSCYNLAKNIKRREEHKANSTPQMQKNILHLLNLNAKALERMNFILSKSDIQPDDALESYNIENAINNFRNDVQISSLDEINSKEYTYQEGVYYHDIINECERLGDYILNVVQAVVEKRF